MAKSSEHCPQSFISADSVPSGAQTVTHMRPRRGAGEARSSSCPFLSTLPFPSWSISSSSLMPDNVAGSPSLANGAAGQGRLRLRCAKAPNPIRRRSVELIVNSNLISTEHLMLARRPPWRWTTRSRELFPPEMTPSLLEPSGRFPSLTSTIALSCAKAPFKAHFALERNAD